MRNQGLPCCWSAAKPPGRSGTQSVLGLELQVSGWGTLSWLSPVTWAPHIGHAFSAPCPWVFSFSAGVGGGWAGCQRTLGQHSPWGGWQGCGSNLGSSRPRVLDCSKYH